MIKWNKKAIRQFDEAIEYINKHSLFNGEKVKKRCCLKGNVAKNSW